MRKSAYINYDDSFIEQDIVELTNVSSRSIKLNEAAATYRTNGEQSIYEQEYKGRYGYLHHVQLHLTTPLLLQTSIEINDLYAVYFLQGSDAITLKSPEGDKLFCLEPKHGLYIYLPLGIYQLEINSGTYHIFSFYFDVGLLDGLQENETHFLSDLIQDVKTNASSSRVSQIFPAGVITTSFIRKLGRHLTKGKWESQLYVLDQLQSLIRLSQEKIQQEQTIHRGYNISGEIIKKMIENGVDHLGMQFDVNKLSEELPVSNQYLQKLYKKTYGETLTAYKKSYLIKKAIPLLLKKIPVIRICELLSFKDERTFYRIFKAQTGLSSQAFLADHYPKLQSNYSEDTKKKHFF